MPGEGVPPCPAWCSLPPDHDVPGRPLRSGELLRRLHVAELVTDETIGEVRLERTDDVLHGGPVLAGTPIVVLDSIERPMTIPEYRRVADELARVVGHLAELDLNDPAGRADQVRDS